MVESAYQKYLRKHYPPDPNSAYQKQTKVVNIPKIDHSFINEDGEEVKVLKDRYISITEDVFVGRQFDLWKFFAHGILPYKKSTICRKGLISLGGFKGVDGCPHAKTCFENTEDQKRNLLYSQYEAQGISEVVSNEKSSVASGPRWNENLSRCFPELDNAWELVGHGEAYPTCGSIIGQKCDNVEGHKDGLVFRRYLKNSCHRRECPIDYESWGSIEGERGLIRLASYVFGVYEIQRILEAIVHKNRALPSSKIHQLIIEKLDPMVRKAIHVVVSLPPDTVLTKQNYRSARNKVVRLLKRAGLHGGAPIFHNYRYHCAKCNSQIPDYHKECPVCGCKDFRWVSSPHFHCIGFGWIHGTKEIYDKSGWIVTNLKARKSVYSTFQYVLSHATYYKDPDPKGKPVSFHIITWYGDLAYNQMPPVPRLMAIKPVCPYCGLMLTRMEDDELNRFPPPIEFDRYLELMGDPM